MTWRLIRLAVLILFLSPHPALSAQTEIVPNQGITFDQVDFTGSPAVTNSAVGLVTVNLIQLRHVTGLPEGFVNIDIGGRWAVRNLPVFKENEFPYSHLSSEFDLGVTAGTNVSSLTASVVFSDEAEDSMPGGSASVFPVGAVLFSTGGIDRSAGGATTPPTMEEVFFGDPANTRAIFQLDHPNIEAAQNQCYPASIANSLQFLEDTTDLEIPHEHRPGLKGDQTLVGQLDTHMNRPAVSRQNNPAGNKGVDDIPGIQGKLKYLAANGLSDRVSTRHWGIYAGASNASQTVNGSTATSTGKGAKIDINAVVQAMEGGEDCEAAYSWTTGTGGGHAIDLVAVGVTRGQPWMIESSDINQSSDAKGAGATGFIFSHLTDPDGDGYLNLNGGNKRLDLMICQKYIPPSVPTGTVVPPPGTALTTGAQVTTTSIIDPAGHICCVTPPPTSMTFNFQNGKVTMSGSASWLPMNLNIGQQGQLSGSNMTTVAGFPNVSNTVSGALTAGGMIAVITLGSQGELPSGAPIKFNVSIAPPQPWPWATRPVTPKLAPAIRANGFRHNHAIASGEPLSVSVSLTQGDQSGNADWWLAAQAGDQLFHYDLQSGSWASGLAPTYQGPLFNLLNTPISMFPSGLPAGAYTLYFGVDRTVNGVLDMNTLTFDAVNLNVK